MLTQEKALSILGIYGPPYTHVRFGSFTGNGTLQRWFRKINDHFGVEGSAKVWFKPRGTHAQPLQPEEALAGLKVGLRGSDDAFIYHCWNHYMCPVGFEEVQEPGKDKPTTWIGIADTSRAYPGLIFRNWADIVADLETEYPEFVDIRQPEPEVGVRGPKSSRRDRSSSLPPRPKDNDEPPYQGQKQNRNLHCILKFSRECE